MHCCPFPASLLLGRRTLRELFKHLVEPPGDLVGLLAAVPLQDRRNLVVVDAGCALLVLVEVDPHRNVQPNLWCVLEHLLSYKGCRFVTARPLLSDPARQACAFSRRYLSSALPTSIMQPTV